MRKMKKTVLLAAVPAVMLVMGTAEATLIRTFTLQGLYAEADCVVVGEVARSGSFWNEAHDTIYTDHFVDVERTVKGTADGEMVLRQMGGRVGDVELSIAGNARLEEGERVLLVMRGNKDFFTLVGMNQGKWSVRTLEGKDHAYRGPSPGDLPRQEGETPLVELLDKMAGRQAGEE